MARVKIFLFLSNISKAASMTAGDNGFAFCGSFFGFFFVRAASDNDKLSRPSFPNLAT